MTHAWLKITKGPGGDDVGGWHNLRLTANLLCEVCGFHFPYPDLFSGDVSMERPANVAVGTDQDPASSRNLDFAFLTFTGTPPPPQPLAPVRLIDEDRLRHNVMPPPLPPDALTLTVVIPPPPPQSAEGEYRPAPSLLMVPEGNQQGREDLALTTDEEFVGDCLLLMSSRLPDQDCQIGNWHACPQDDATAPAATAAPAAAAAAAAASTHRITEGRYTGRTCGPDVPSAAIRVPLPGS